jgi:hypothetical protein
VVDGERAGREQDVQQLAPAVEEAGEVAPRGSMVEVDLDLFHAQPRPECVDRHPHLAAEARCQRKARRAGSGTQATLARQRLARCEAGAEGDELTGDSLGDPEPAAGFVAESRDDQVGVTLL